jgi:diaminopimelate epimerase
MGEITFDPAQIPVDVVSPFDLEAVVDGTTYRGDAAGIGNPHFVFVVDDPATTPVVAHGARIEHDARFPRRTNVEFIALAGTDRLTMRVWERGVG